MGHRYHYMWKTRKKFLTEGNINLGMFQSNFRMQDNPATKRNNIVTVNVQLLSHDLKWSKAIPRSHNTLSNHLFGLVTFPILYVTNDNKASKHLSSTVTFVRYKVLHFDSLSVVCDCLKSGCT